MDLIAGEFEDGAPQIAVQMHRHYQILTDFLETRIWNEEAVNHWPPMPELDSGIYTFLIRYSENATQPGKAHRFLLVKNQGQTALFDPNTGLSIWNSSDWESILDATGSLIRTARAGYFKLECYQYLSPATE